MPENVEIKAKLNNFGKIFDIVSGLCSSNERTLLIQEDVFFNVPNGRLKLRKFEDGKVSQLISYIRPDTEGPKLSNYSICEVSKDILPVLQSALGVKGVVRKKRHLFLYGQTRIHLDKVEGLGEFLELEVVLKQGQSASDGVKIANELLTKLEISEKDLIRGAYIDFQ